MSAEKPSHRDALFLDPERQGRFAFDERVAEVLPDMLERSIPGYTSLLELIGVVSTRLPGARLRVYDLGCSLGAVTSSVLRALEARPVEVIAVDSSRAMIDRFRETLGPLKSGDHTVEVRCEDVVETPIVAAHLVVLNFTLQFVPLERRDELVSKIAAGLEPGGVLVLSEKTEPEPADRELMLELHDEFRRQRGYSDLEMARKRDALRNVLFPESCGAHTLRLARAGLRPFEWFRGLEFVSWLAIKPS